MPHIFPYSAFHFVFSEMRISGFVFVKIQCFSNVGCVIILLFLFVLSEVHSPILFLGL